MAGRYEAVMEDRKKLVGQIIENMKQGYVLPQPDWDRDAFPNMRIQNPVSGARYRGAILSACIWQVSKEDIKTTAG